MGRPAGVTGGNGRRNREVQVDGSGGHAGAYGLHSDDHRGRVGRVLVVPGHRVGSGERADGQVATGVHHVEHRGRARAHLVVVDGQLGVCGNRDLEPHIRTLGEGAAVGRIQVGGVRIAAPGARPVDRQPGGRRDPGDGAHAQVARRGRRPVEGDVVVPGGTRSIRLQRHVEGFSGRCIVEIRRRVRTGDNAVRAAGRHDLYRGGGCRILVDGQQLACGNIHLEPDFRTVRGAAIRGAPEVIPQRRPGVGVVFSVVAARIGDHQGVGAEISGHRGL